MIVRSLINPNTMNTKTTLITVAVLVIAVVAVYMLAMPQQAVSPENGTIETETPAAPMDTPAMGTDSDATDEPAPDTTAEQVSDSADATDTSAPADTTVPEPLPPVDEPSPTPEPDDEPVDDTADASSITMTEVAMHGDRDDCWTVVRGIVYDVTDYVDKHPAGAGDIIRMCGVDATDDFVDEHGGDSKPEGMLDNYEIGTLAP
jgi:cytochrome b involved in lipid metabolism